MEENFTYALRSIVWLNFQAYEILYLSLAGFVFDFSFILTP